MSSAPKTGISTSSSTSYSTFTSEIQAQRLAALKPTADEYAKAEKAWLGSRILNSCSSCANRMSNSLSNLCTEIVYRMATACTPCFEILSAMNFLRYIIMQGLPNSKIHNCIILI